MVLLLAIVFFHELVQDVCYILPEQQVCLQLIILDACLAKEFLRLRQINDLVLLNQDVVLFRCKL
jgi:hypothetical protein